MKDRRDRDSVLAFRPNLHRERGNRACIKRTNSARSAFTRLFTNLSRHVQAMPSRLEKCDCSSAARPIVDFPPTTNLTRFSRVCASCSFARKNAIVGNQADQTVHGPSPLLPEVSGSQVLSNRPNSREPPHALRGSRLFAS